MNDVDIVIREVAAEAQRLTKPFRCQETAGWKNRGVTVLVQRIELCTRLQTACVNLESALVQPLGRLDNLALRARVPSNSVD
jgi:hypothetical protein